MKKNDGVCDVCVCVSKRIGSTKSMLFVFCTEGRRNNYTPVIEKEERKKRREK